MRARPDLDVLAKGEVDLLEVDVLHELDRREGVIFAGHEVLVLQQSFVERFSTLHISSELLFAHKAFFLLLMRHYLNYNLIYKLSLTLTVTYE